MAHVLAAHADADIHATLHAALTDEGHCVTTTNDATLALSALWICRHPLVVLLNEQLGPLSGRDVLELVAEDETGRLSRHSYILMSMAPSRAALTTLTNARLAKQPRQLRVPILEQPFDLDDLYALVSQAEAATQSWGDGLPHADESHAEGPDAHIAPAQRLRAPAYAMAPHS